MTQFVFKISGNIHEIERLEQHLAFDIEELGLAMARFEEDEAKKLWGLSVYSPDAARAQVQSLMEDAALSINPNLTLYCEPLEEKNWTALSLKNLAPVKVGKFVVHGSHDVHKCKAWQTAILVDAGQAFGTGHHGTTFGCLAMIEACFKHHNPNSIMDLGTGSGVLAIAMAKRYHVCVLASDIDPVATLTAQENVQRNRVTPWVHCKTATGFDHIDIRQRSYDLIVANILARPLQKLAPEFARHTHKGSQVILSGLLEHQRAPILAAFRTQGFSLCKSIMVDHWLTLRLKK